MSPALVVGQLRAHFGRYLATVLAIAVSVAFVVASGGLIATLRSSTLDVFAQRYVGTTAAVQHVGDRTAVQSDEDRADVAATERAALDAIASTPGVAAWTIDRETMARVIPHDGQTQRFTSITSLATDDGLRWQRLAAGHWPDGPGELLAPAGQDLGVGAVVELRVAGNSDPQTATIVGTYDYVAQPDSVSDFPLFTNDAQLREWVPAGAGGEVRIRGDAAGSPRELSAAVTKALDGVPGTESYKTATAQARTQQLASTFLGGLRVLDAAIYGFTVVAIAVSALVIASTFAVLLAGRVREMALLRTLGATRLQTRATALAEALVIALLATALGLVVGSWSVGAIAARADLLGVTFPLTTRPAPSWSYALAAATGIGVTLLAAAWPIWRATSPGPLAALRPVDVRPQSWFARVAIAVVGVAAATGGVVMLGRFVAERQSLGAAGSGVLVFLGVLLCVSVAVPAALGVIGLVLSPVPGALGLLGARNGARSPRRTASIAAALLVAVTLVAALASGVTFLRPTLEQKFVNRIPLDVAVSSPDGILPDGLADDLAGSPGVHRSVVVTNVPLSVPDEATSSGTRTVPARTADPAELQDLMSRPIILPEPGQIVVPTSSPLYSYFFGPGKQPRDPAPGVDLFKDHHRVLTPIPSDDRWVLLNPVDVPPWPVAQGPDGEPWPEGVEVPLEFVPRHEVWLQLDPALPSADRERDLAGIRERAAEARPDMTVAEAFRARDQLRDAVDTVLTATSLLLAVSVVIALIGVVNTYGLAVAERRRELALLRGVGVTRGGVRVMLLVEALLVSALTCAVGVLLGAYLGRAGASAFLGEIAVRNISTPWSDVVAVGVAGVVVAVVAAGISSVRASRVPPAGMELR